MKNLPYWTGLGLVAVLTTGGGLIHGKLSNRWGAPQKMIDAGEKIQHLPSQIGTWKLRTSERLAESARSMLECTGDVAARYENATTTESVGLTLVVGPAGTISVHSPEVCLPSQNFRIVKPRRLVKVRDAADVEHEFWVTEFQTQDVESQHVCVYYAWSTGGSWSSPNDARIKFAGTPFLYKIQLVASALPGATRPQDDAASSFLRVFLPEARAKIVTTVADR
jgi:uncharacterized protein DUF3485